MGLQHMNLGVVWHTQKHSVYNRPIVPSNKENGEHCRNSSSKKRWGQEGLVEADERGSELGRSGFELVAPLLST